MRSPSTASIVSCRASSRARRRLDGRRRTPAKPGRDCRARAPDVGHPQHLAGQARRARRPVPDARRRRCRRSRRRRRRSQPAGVVAGASRDAGQHRRHRSGEGEIDDAVVGRGGDVGVDQVVLRVVRGEREVEQPAAAAWCPGPVRVRTVCTGCPGPAARARCGRWCARRPARCCRADRIPVGAASPRGHDGRIRPLFAPRVRRARRGCASAAGRVLPDWLGVPAAGPRR